MRWSMTRYCGGERVIGCAVWHNRKLQRKHSGFQTVPKEAKKMQIENPIKNCVSHTLADITKTKDASGYNPEYSLEEGIRELM